MKRIIVELEVEEDKCLELEKACPVECPFYMNQTCSTLNGICISCAMSTAKIVSAKLKD